MNDLNRIPQINPHYRFQFEKAQNCYVLLYPEGMVKLNPSAGEILSRVDGQQSVGEIIAALQAQFPDAPGLADDVLAFMSDAESKNWLK
ncbi:pyrroloquinoline quinone biosynthesis peptide chaperone PqqD [Granulosicoccaceae sp. 1_MG-2023]|nr:pyrroloquinoline quinone biosynthesis peptide chaperone PqqD [Granulosicoccaceae sp. 1_MG-2023]